VGGFGYLISPTRMRSGTLVEHWNGASWAIVPSPIPDGATGARLESVTCSNASSCMAVGSCEDPKVLYVTLAEQWDGSAWTVLSTPNPPSAKEAVLSSIACDAITHCIAVGASAPGGPNFTTLGEEWDGAAWTIQETADPLTPGAAD